VSGEAEVQHSEASVFSEFSKTVLKNVTIHPRHNFIKYLSAKFQTMSNVQRLVQVEQSEYHLWLHRSKELFQGFCQVVHQPLVGKPVHVNGQLDVEEICFVAINKSIKYTR
jgi:hypothetical protein